MASITYWSRLEPRPRSPSVSQSLSARVRDPLWMLTRQWQFGELQGEDAGSPAYADLSTRISPIVGWRMEGQPTQPLPADVPLEALVETEPFTPDHSVRVELGQTFEALLSEAFVGASVPEEIIATLRAAYPTAPGPDETLVALLFNLGLELQVDLNNPGEVSAALRLALGENGLLVSERTVVAIKATGSQWLITDQDTGKIYAIRREDDRLNVYLAAVTDQETARFLAVCTGRAIDGVALYGDALASLPALPPTLAVDATHEGAVVSALQNFLIWVREVFGAFGAQDAPTWNPERLEYGVEVVSSIAAGGTAVLSAYPDQDGDFEWYSFDFRSAQAGDVGVLSEPTPRSVLPIHVRFRGMPNARWWDFETSTTDFGDIRPDRRDLAKLVVMDFMLVHGNDWFVIPFSQPVGSLCHIGSLIVHDVFGGLTLVERADAGAEPEGRRWTMFSTTIEGESAQLAQFLIIPPSASAATQIGPAIEEVRFVRDEMANMVWAVEHTTENGIGQPWVGDERDLAAKLQAPAARPAEATSDRAGKAPLRYQLQTTVPTNWIPFLPVALNGDIALERGVMLRPVLGAGHQTIDPMGRILRPTIPGGASYRVREEEVPRSGVRVLRVVCRSRWTDGSTHLWIARPKTVGAGEASSGLRFDLANPNK